MSLPQWQGFTIATWACTNILSKSKARWTVEYWLGVVFCLAFLLHLPHLVCVCDICFLLCPFSSGHSLLINDLPKMQCLVWNSVSRCCLNSAMANRLLSLLICPWCYVARIPFVRRGKQPNNLYLGCSQLNYNFFFHMLNWAFPSCNCTIDYLSPRPQNSSIPFQYYCICLFTFLQPNELI